MFHRISDDPFWLTVLPYAVNLFLFYFFAFLFWYVGLLRRYALRNKVKTPLNYSMRTKRQRKLAIMVAGSRLKHSLKETILHSLAIIVCIEYERILNVFQKNQ